MSLTSLRVTRRAAADDRGVVLVVAALTLAALMTMSAIAVDLGGVYNERRQDQSAADTAALAAVQDLPDRTAAVQTAKSVASNSLGGEVISDAAWDTCDDDPAATPVPPGYQRHPGASCIAFNGGRAFVRLPVREYDAAFAGLIGIDAFDHSAFAVAGVETEGFGGVLPFALSANASVFTCIERSGGSGAEKETECRQDSSTPGNFGALDFGHFGNETLGTVRSCAPSGTASRFANNIAVGADHDIEVFDVNEVVDTDQCMNPVLVPNAASGFTGTTDKHVGAGLYSGGTFSDGLGPRLTRLGTVDGTPAWMLGSGRTTNIDGAIVDDIPLWEFLPTSPPMGWNVPRSCYPDQFSGSDSALPSGVAAQLQGYDDADRMLRLMERCLMHYEGDAWDDGGQLTPAEQPCTRLANPSGTGTCSGAPSGGFTSPIFLRDTDPDESPNLYDIQYTPRFGYVPQTTAPQGSSTPARVDSFRAVFIQRLKGGCSGGGSSCSLRFDPGVGYELPNAPSNLGGRTDTVGVFMLPRDSLPNGLAGENAPYELNVNRFVELVR